MKRRFLVSACDINTETGLSNWLWRCSYAIAQGFRELALIRPAFAGLILIGAVSAPVQAEDLTVAVAANFLVPARALETQFEATSGHQVVVTSGSTGQLYAQIVNGAPYDILLAADQERPGLLAVTMTS